MMKLLRLFSLLLTFLILLFACKEINPNDVQLGDQLWMNKNLSTACFKNGSPILHAKTADEWNFATKNKIPAWCNYQNLMSNGKIVGKLYNWYAVTDSRGLAPQGYHIPSDKEWSILFYFLGGDSNAGNAIKSKTGWSNDGNGSNIYSFNALPGGYRVNTNGAFVYLFYNANFWSTTSFDKYHAFGWGLVDYNGNLNRFHDSKSFGFSVRCIKNR